MRIGRIAHGRVETLAFLAILLLIAAPGCGARKADQSATSSQSSDGSNTQTMVVANAPEAGARPGAPQPGTPAWKASHTVHHITLTDHECVRFEPQWTRVHVGEAITWHSDLTTPLRIYVSPGIFSRESFLIRPGATVSSGPAKAPGRYSFWTEPSACREAPRGVLLAGPGVKVAETFYASAPGIH